MCLSAPIPVEVNPPSSPEAFERFGLFYLKIPQRIIGSCFQDADARVIGEKFAKLYLDEMKVRKIRYDTDLLYFLKTFIVFLSRSETAQRVLNERVLFVVTDIEKIYKTDVIKEVLKTGVNYLRNVTGFLPEVDIKFVSLILEEMGCYYCAKCRMFFEFGMKRDKVTCPLMAQKCMFKPQNIDIKTGTMEDIIKIYKITPHLYEKFIGKLPQSHCKESLPEALNLFVRDIDKNDLKIIGKELGIK